jgi:hypothetical protein
MKRHGHVGSVVAEAHRLLTALPHELRRPALNPGGRPSRFRKGALSETANRFGRVAFGPFHAKGGRLWLGSRQGVHPVRTPGPANGY